MFCASLADWLDEEVSSQWREDLFDLIDSCPNLDWLMLTKRPRNALDMLPVSWWENPRPWVWFGVTAENQKYWDIRVPIMASIPACVRWVSYEPSLGPLMIDSISARSVNWLIIGGESNQTEPARRFDLEWAESSILQCRENDIAPFVKQMGSNAFYRGKPISFKEKSGSNTDEWPECVRVREMPESLSTSR